ncbi:MAG: hypothetical protein H7Z16_15670 [Pyrinomonadaceae bacterium]|nr:hypothetical protein [Pyrinomonadaceae bacterium]
MATFTLDRAFVSPLPLSGATAHASPALAGSVLEDRLVQFQSLGSTPPLVTGAFQERIVRSRVDGTLAFYYRITELRGGELDQFFRVELGPLPTPRPTVEVEYRTDGLGVIGPQGVLFDGAAISFVFSASSPGRTIPVTETALSRFMFFKLTSAESSGRPITYAADRFGRISMRGVRWATGVIGNSFHPVFS